jgi:cobalamin-dependent methionine synthase I
MLIVGERINSTRKRVKPAIIDRDEEVIRSEAQLQIKAGANYLDCNAAEVGVDKEPDTLPWLVEYVQEVTDDIPIAIDSPNVKAIEAALAVHKGEAMINSITAEKERLDSLLSVVADSGSKVVALVMDDTGIPNTAEKRIEVGRKLLGTMMDAGVEADKIHVDPLVFPISTDGKAGLAVMETISTLKREFPGIHFICGLSNVSYGLPNRKLLNQAFMVLNMSAGLDSVIVDPTDRKLMSLVYATEALLDKDEFCMNYIGKGRAEELE